MIVRFYKNCIKEFGNEQLDFGNIQLKKNGDKGQIQKPAKILEKSLNENDNLSKYNKIKNGFDTIYDHIADGIHIRSKCNWYEHSEKSKFFFILEKQRGSQNSKKLIADDKKITNQTQILEYIKRAKNCVRN